MATSTNRALVAQVITRLNIGGPAAHALLLGQSLHDSGFESALISGKEGLREGQMVPIGSTNLVRLPYLRREVAPIADLLAYRSLRRIFRQRRPDIIHSHMAKAGAIARLAARSVPGSVVVHTFHGHVLDGYFSRVQERAIAKIERTLAKKTDALVAVSFRTRDQLLDLGIGRPEQWRVIPLGVDLESIAAPDRSRSHARRTLGLPDGFSLVGIVGRLADIKNHETFFAAAIDVMKNEPNTMFVVAGDGPSRSKLENLVARSLAGHVLFLGWVSDLSSLYAALDVVVLTSKNEGTPVALIEAGAAQVPVVATDVGGVREVVIEGITGLLTKPEDPSHVASQILRLLRDPDLAQRMGQAAKDQVYARFSAARQLGEIQALYRELLARKKK